MKQYPLVLVILIPLLLVSCAKKPANEINEMTEEIQNNVSQMAATPGCGNIFYPLRQDNRWAYRLEFAGTPGREQADLTMRVADVRQNGAGLSVVSQAIGVEDSSEIRCENGAIIEFPFIEMDVLFGGLGGGVDVTYESGVFMPAEDDFKKQNWTNKWTTQYRINGQFEGRYQGEKMTAIFANSPARMEWEVIAKGGQLRVAAGEFADIVHIRRTAIIDVTTLQVVVSETLVQLGTTLTMVTNMYYAAGVGMLKQDFDSATVSLPLGIQIPIQGTGSMEMVSYRLRD